MESKAYKKYKKAIQQVADLRYASALLQWDQETYMPVNGAKFRGQQIAGLSTLSHQYFTSNSFGNLLQSLLQDPSLSFMQRANVEQSFWEYRRQKKLPASFVRKLSETVNASFHAWIDARRKNDFRVFEKQLSKIVKLKIREAAYIGYEQNPYDALLQEFDQSLNVNTIDQIFSELHPPLTSLINKIYQKQAPDHDFMHQFYEKDKQWDWGIQLLKDMHFNFDAGRQDISEHPFTTNFSAEDVRVTTRIDEHDLANMTWSCLHEGGHALYEQGLPAEEYGLPSGEYCSLSIHESQSRLWENCIGRSEPYWEFQFPRLQQIFPTQLGRVSADQFYRAMNRVQPSLIRTEADELNYHFHVMIRYNLEKKLINNEITVKDIPEFWNEAYTKDIGITPQDDLTGCLQDVHWSHGSFGYFATYSIGSLYAAQFFARIEKENPNYQEQLKSGNSGAAWQWLQKHIYPFGKTYHSEALCEKATGEKLNSRYFMDYANKKFGALYRL